MHQVLVIFRKDARHLWPRVVPALALTGAIGWLDCLLPSSPLAGIVEILWVLCWMYAGACLIHEENPTGDRQFWRTRPYDWRVLLLAKALFLAAFAVVPLLLAEAAALAVNGLSPFRYAAVLLSTSIRLACAVALIAAAVAAVTENLVQSMWGFLALAAIETVTSVLASGGSRWETAGWMRAAALGGLILVAGIPVLLLQYAFRKTQLSRSIILGVALLPAGTPLIDLWHAGWVLQTKLSSRTVELPEVLLSFDSAAKNRVGYANAPFFPGPARAGLYLPVRLSGVPAGTGVVTERTSAAIHTADGERWKSGWVPARGLTQANPRQNLAPVREDGSAWLYLDMDRPIYEAVKDAAVRIDISLALTLLDDPQTMPLRAPGRTAHLPESGICEVTPGPTLPNGVRGVQNLIASCAWPGMGPAYAALLAGSFATAGSSEVPLLYRSRGPLWFYGSVWQRDAALFPAPDRGLDLRLETWRGAAVFERSLTIPQIRLKDYAAPRATDFE